MAIMGWACEVCEGHATHCCSGLDVPMLWFCEQHGREHAETCPDVRAGRSWLDGPAAPPVAP